MRSFQEHVHSKNVEYWFSLASKGMTPKDQVLLLEKGIATVERRACQTLSSITLKFVIDRVRHQTQQKFSVISDVTLDEKFLNFSAMDREKYALEKVDALTYLLVELMKDMTEKMGAKRVAIDSSSVFVHKMSHPQIIRKKIVSTFYPASNGSGNRLLCL